MLSARFPSAEEREKCRKTFEDRSSSGPYNRYNEKRKVLCCKRVYIGVKCSANGTENGNYYLVLYGILSPKP